MDLNMLERGTKLFRVYEVKPLSDKWAKEVVAVEHINRSFGLVHIEGGFSPYGVSKDKNLNCLQSTHTHHFNDYLFFTKEQADDFFEKQKLLHSLFQYYVRYKKNNRYPTETLRKVVEIFKESENE